jgi:hypothetical protein
MTATAGQTGKSPKTEEEEKYERNRLFQNLLSAASTLLSMRTVVPRVDLFICTLCSSCVNEILTRFRHVELALRADDTPFLATSCKLQLVSYFCRLDHWLQDCKIV